MGGTCRHTIAFSLNYEARPRAVLHAGEATVGVSIEIENLKKTAMDLMYMAHVNFRPLDNGRLVYSAPCTRETARVRTVIPPHVNPTPRYRAFLEELSEDPAKHNVLAPGLAFDPEVVFFLEYKADTDGWARSMMVHPDGYASVIRHKPGQLDHGVRWISRTPDQDCFGLCLPSTAEPDGYHAEKAKGNVRSLAGGARSASTARQGCSRRPRRATRKPRSAGSSQSDALFVSRRKAAGLIPPDPVVTALLPRAIPTGIRRPVHSIVNK